MWQAFTFENLYFALNVLAGLTFMLVAWLYFDAWKETERNVEKWKIMGFGLLGIAFFLRSLDLTQLVTSQITRLGELARYADHGFRSLGYFLIIIGLLSDPLQKKPKLHAFVAFGFGSLSFVSPLLSSLIALLYLRRSSIGLERHLYAPSISFFLLSFYELFFSLQSFSDTNNLFVFKLLSSFGVNWAVYTAFLTLSILIIGIWVIRYLLKQFETQIFIYQMLLIVLIYFSVTATFTGFLINDVKKLILSELSNENKVVVFATDSEKEKLLSEARYIVISKSLKTENDSLIKFDKNGVITFQAEDEERKGSSISSDNLVKEILSGKEVSDMYIKDGASNPVIMVRSGVPTYSDEEKIDGGVIVSEILDSAWVSGFEKNTNLKVSLYGGNVQSAGSDLGIKETNLKVLDNVLSKGREYSDETNYLNKNYLSSFSAIKDIYGNPIGMFFVGRPATDVLMLMVDTLEIIFASTLALLIVSIIPAKIISKSIARQIK